MRGLPSPCKWRLRTGAQVSIRVKGIQWQTPLRLSPSHPPLCLSPLSLCLSLPVFSHLTDRPESHVTSNDSDSELEEGPELLSSEERGALHRLSFLEKQSSEASVEEAQDSGSEEQLGPSAGEDGD